MIEFYRPISCESCTRIEAALQEMVIAHKVIIVEPGQSDHGLSPSITLPAFKEKSRVISGQANIKAYLHELEVFTERWRLFQSDSCYCDE